MLNLAAARLEALRVRYETVEQRIEWEHRRTGQAVEMTQTEGQTK
jgi:hypothetical protein